MKSRNIVVVAGITAILLSGCSLYTQADMDEKEEEYQAKIDEYEAELQENEEQIDEYEMQLADLPDANEDTEPDELNEVYDEIYNDYLAENDLRSSDVSCGEILLTNDDIMDFYIWDGAKLDIYSVDEDGNANHIVDDARTIGAQYFEKMGILVLGTEWNYGLSSCDSYYFIDDEHPYQNSSEPILSYIYTSDYDFETDTSNGTSETYYHNGEEITEDEYNTLLQESGICFEPAGDPAVADGCIGYITIGE